MEYKSYILYYNSYLSVLMLENLKSMGLHTVSGNALYNAGHPKDYELHDSEETNLVLKILLYAGVSIKDPNIAQLADAKETKKITQEKS